MEIEHAMRGMRLPCRPRRPPRPSLRALREDDGIAAFEAVAARIAGFERYYESIAKPFEWKFTRRDLVSSDARQDPTV
ncbi:MAG: hypothetical protein ACREV1_02330 [Gammaproteobacteria bacterium]